MSILSLRRLRLRQKEFQTSLTYTARPSFKNVNVSFLALQVDGTERYTRILAGGRESLWSSSESAFNFWTNAEGDHVGVLMIVTSPALFYQSISLEKVGRKLGALTFRNSKYLTVRSSGPWWCLHSPVERQPATSAQAGAQCLLSSLVWKFMHLYS